MKSRLTIRLLVCLFSLLPLAQPPLAAAQSGDWVETGEEVDASAGSAGVKFFDLALCTVSIVAISSGVGAVIAALTCGRAAVVWFQE